MEGGPDVVDLRNAVHGSGQHVWIGQVSDDDVGHTGRAQGPGRFFGANAGAKIGSHRQEPRDQQFALITVGRLYE